MKVTNIGNLT